MTKFSNKLKRKPLFLTHFGGKIFFLKNSSCQAQHHMGLSHHAEFQKKLTSQSQENAWTEGQTDPNSWNLPATAGVPLK